MNYIFHQKFNKRVHFAYNFTNEVYKNCLLNLLIGAYLERAKGAKAAFEILAKCFVFIAALSNQKHKFETPFELMISCVKSREFYSVT